MSDATLNSIPIMRGDIFEPPAGAWTADLELLSEGIDNPLTGSAKLVLLGETFSGTIAHAPDNQESALSGNSGGFIMARVVGGAGGMQTAVDPKEWAQGATVSMVLTELLTRAGETQALDIDPSILARTLPQWSYPTGTVETALSALTAYLGIVWRIRRDGRVWLGKPAPTPAPAPDYIIIDNAPEAGMVGWSLNELGAHVDDIIDGLTIQSINWVFDGGSLRALVRYAPGPEAALFQLFDRWLRRAGYPYVKAQPGRIASQNSDSTVQFQPDDSQTSPMRRVGIRVGLPDTTVQINPSSRAVACWEAGAPTGPVLQSFGSSTASKIRLAASQTPLAVARKTDTTKSGTLAAAVATPMAGTNVVTLTYTDSEGATTPLLTLTFVMGLLTAAAPPSIVAQVNGRITGGSTVVEAGG